MVKLCVSGGPGFACPHPLTYLDRMNAHLRLAAVVLVSALSLPACKDDVTQASVAPPSKDEVTASSPTPEAPAATPVEVSDPCTLLTADEVHAAVGDSVQGKSSTSGGVLACTWLRPGHRSVVVQFHKSARRFDDSKQALQDFHKFEAEPLENLGEQAFYVGGKTGNSGTATVVALKSGRFVNVQILTPSESAEDVKDQVISLTRAVVDRI